MWSWKHIKRHRQQVKQYKELYKTKITNKKPTETLLKKLEVNSGDLAKWFLTIAMKIRFDFDFLISVCSGTGKCKVCVCDCGKC